MRRVRLDKAQTGAVVARAIHTLDGVFLLSAGTVLTPEHKEKLQNYGITEIYIEDTISEGIEIPELIREEVITEVKSQVKKMMTSPSIKVSVDVKKVGEIVERLIANILENDRIVASLCDVRSIDEYTFSHSVNVSVISIVTGIGVGMKEDTLRDLGIGALLHDLGKVMVDDTILRKPTNLTSIEYDEVKKHTYYGYEILQKSENISREACDIALSHHERLDGSGYPRRLKSSDIQIFARIAAIADVYDALTTDKVYRRKMMPHDVLDYMLSLGGKHFDKSLLDAFVRHIAYYPVGTAVILNSGEKGLVSEYNPYFPNRPVVRVVIDESGHSLKKYREVDLSKKLEYRVVAVWDI
ncbi:MAG: HD-GYP domain-containing protein [Clostridiaceae bacterium]|nr:HD-GYP domain-containing protein [Clostridiaceae bacterium]